jgi:hypothetical protein
MFSFEPILAIVNNCWKFKIQSQLDLSRSTHRRYAKWVKNVILLLLSYIKTPHYFSRKNTVSRLPVYTKDICIHILLSFFICFFPYFYSNIDQQINIIIIYIKGILFLVFFRMTKRVFVTFKSLWRQLILVNCLTAYPGTMRLMNCDLVNSMWLTTVILSESYQPHYHYRNKMNRT